MHIRRMEVAHDQYVLPSEDEVGFAQIAKKSNLERKMVIKTLDNFYYTQLIRNNNLTMHKMEISGITIDVIDKSNDFLAEAVEACADRVIKSPDHDMDDQLALVSDLFISGTASQKDIFESAGFDNGTYSPERLWLALGEKYLEDKGKFPKTVAALFRDDFSNDLAVLLGEPIHTDIESFEDSVKDLEDSELTTLMNKLNNRLGNQRKWLEQLAQGTAGKSKPIVLERLDQTQAAITATAANCINQINNDQSLDEDQRIDAIVGLFKLVESNQLDLTNAILEREDASRLPEELREQITEHYYRKPPRRFAKKVIDIFANNFDDEIKQVQKYYEIDESDTPLYGDPIQVLGQAMGDFTEELQYHLGLFHRIDNSLDDAETYKLVEELDERSVSMNTVFGNAVDSILAYTEDDSERVELLSELFLALDNCHTPAVATMMEKKPIPSYSPEELRAQVEEAYAKIKNANYRKEITGMFRDQIYKNTDEIIEKYGREDSDSF